MAYKNPEDAAAWKKAWALKNKEKVKEIRKAYRERNKERLAAEYKTWRLANKGKLNAKVQKRHAARLNRTPGWLTEEDLGKIESIYKEAQRLREETGEGWHVDHIIPLQGEKLSGLHVPDNLQVIRAKDNLSKHNRYEI